jgi:hypothetical protein
VSICFTREYPCCARLSENLTSFSDGVETITAWSLSGFCSPEFFKVNPVENTESESAEHTVSNKIFFILISSFGIL